MHTGFWWGNLRDGQHLEDLGVDVRIILKWIRISLMRGDVLLKIKTNLQEVGREGIDWIELAQIRDSWSALVNAVMNIRVPQNAGNFLTS